jgi:hypothetical protein
MAVFLSPVGGVAAQFFTNTGAVLTGGKLYTYAAGTTTPAVTYTSSGGGIPQPNPIVLDAAGRVPNSGEIWLGDGIQYKFVLKDANDVLIATYDNISGINSNFTNFLANQEIFTATAGQTVFTLANAYTPGANTLSVFVDGVNQYGPGATYAYFETDANTVTFVSGLHVGASVKFTTVQSLTSSQATSAALVSYTPAGTGAVTTTVQAKLRQTVSSADFGVDATGATSATVKMQAAIDYCLANSVDLFVPSGDYLLSTALVIKLPNLGTQFELVGSGSTNFLCGFNGIVLTVGDATYEGTQDGYGFVKIKNVNFESNGFTTATAIAVRGQKRILFEDMYISGAFLNGITLKSVYATPVIRNVRINGCTGTGITALGQVNNFLYESCAFLACAKGFYGSINSGTGLPSSELDSNTFLNCDFEGNDRSIEVDSPGGCQALRIVDCHFEANTGYEIYLGNYTSTSVAVSIVGITITGNIFYGLHGIYVGNSASGGNVIGVLFAGNYVVSDVAGSIRIGADCPAITFNAYTYGNAYASTSTATDLVAHPVASLPGTSTNRLGPGDLMPLYQATPVEPYGTAASGIQGDIRYAANKLWVRTATGWMVSQLQRVNDYATGPVPQTATGATISALNFYVCTPINTGTPATITSITNGYASQQLLLCGTDGGATTVAHGTNIRLAGGANFVLGDNDTLTLVCVDGTKWIEVCRSNNT